MQQSNNNIYNNEVSQSKDIKQLNQSLLNSKKLDNENLTPRHNLSYTRDNSTRFNILQNSKVHDDSTRYNNNYKNRQYSSSIVQPSSSSNPIYYLYQFWKGQHTFLLQGFVQLGPRIHFVWNVVFWMFILMMGGVHLIFVIPYIMDSVSLGLGLTYIIIFILLVIFAMLTQFSDPGYIPRRKMVKAIPKIQQRIDKVDEMINEQAYKTIMEMQNDQQCQKLGQVDGSQLKMSGYSNAINNSKLENSYGNQFMNARTNMQSDLFLFKKTGSIQSHILKNTGTINTHRLIEKNEQQNMNKQQTTQITPEGLKKCEQSRMPNNGLRSPNNLNIQQNANAIYQEINRINESRLQDQLTGLAVQQKNSLPNSSQNTDTVDQTQSRTKNPFVPVEEANNNNRKPPNRDEWTDDSQRNTTELYTQGFGDVQERDEQEEDDGNDQNQNNRKYRNRQQDKNKREQFHMHIHIQNENGEENDQDGEEMTKRRTIFSYLDRKVSRQRISQHSQLNSLAKEDTQQGDVMIDYNSENKIDIHNLDGYRNEGDQQTEDIESGNNLALKDQYENHLHLKQKIMNNRNNNIINGNSNLKAEQQNSQNMLSSGKSIADPNNPNSGNFLCVKNGVLLQESMISPKIDVNGIIQKNNLQNYCNENVCMNKNSSCHHISTQHLQQQKQNGNVLSNSNSNNAQQGISNSAQSNVSAREQIDDRKLKESISSSIIKSNKSVNNIANSQDILTNNQNKSVQLNILKESNPVYNERDSTNKQQLQDEKYRYFKGKNLANNNVNQLINAAASDQMHKSTNQHQQSNLQVDDILEHQKQFQENNSKLLPSKPEIFTKKIFSDQDKQTNCKETQIKGEPAQITSDNDSDNEKRNDRKSTNIFTFKAQKCNNIQTNHFTNFSSDNQDKQRQIYESELEENKQSVDISNNQVNTNLFAKSKNQTNTQLRSQEKLNIQTNTITNSAQNEDDVNAHRQFMMLSQHSNTITPKNNNHINLKINLQGDNARNFNENHNTINILTGGIQVKGNVQAIKLNEKFSYEMARHDQNVKRLSDSLMQQNPLNVSGSRQKNDTIQNRNIFDIQSSSSQTPSKNANQYYNGRKYCVTCKIFRPPRSSHCTYCDCCVEVFDHHCKFVNNCIGKHNYKYFFSFLSLLKFTFLLQFISEMCYIVKKKVSSTSTITHGEFAMGIIYLIVIFLSWLYVLYLWGFHIYIQYRQLTTREQLRDLESDRDPSNYFNWCQDKNPIFQARIIVTDNQRYDLLDDY